MVVAASLLDFLKFIPGSPTSFVVMKKQKTEKKQKARRLRVQVGVKENALQLIVIIWIIGFVSYIG